jgi:multicomponent Na+:H+ antiporter subunit E
MRLFLVNLLLALLWASLQQFRPIDFLGGFALGFLILLLGRNWLSDDATPYVRRVPVFIGFVIFYIGELITSAWSVVQALFRDQSTLRPGIVALRIEARTDLEIVLLNNLLSLTPGTLGVGLSPDRKLLYVHIIDVPDPDAACERIRTGLERRLLEVLR